MNVKYGIAGRYMTTAQIKTITDEVYRKAKQELRNEIMREILDRDSEIRQTYANDSIYFHTVCYAYVLSRDFARGERKLFRVIEKVADTMDAINARKLTLEGMEDELRKKGISLVKSSET